MSAWHSWPVLRFLGFSALWLGRGFSNDEDVFRGSKMEPHRTGLAPRIFFIFAPLLREEGGGGSEGRGNFSKIRGKRGKNGGGEVG